MYGEDYDQIVDNMSSQQKIELKDSLINRGDEEITKVAEKLHKLMQEKSRESSIGSTVSPFSLAASTPSFHLPPDFSPQLSLGVARSPEPPCTNFKVPVTNQPAEPTYSLPTTSSLGRKTHVSPSPKKSTPTPWMPPSPSPKFASSLSPSRTVRPLASRIPQPVFSSLTPQRVLQTIPSTPTTQHRSATPSSSKKSSRVAGLRAAEYAAIASPVAEYVRSNPAPPLVQ